MRIDVAILWILIGASTAVLYLKSQQWTVTRLDPNKASYSLRLIIGGAILRWVLILTSFIASISHSYQALLIVFTSFMVIRIIFLLKWQGWLHKRYPFVRQS